MKIIILSLIVFSSFFSIFFISPLGATNTGDIFVCQGIDIDRCSGTTNSAEGDCVCTGAICPEFCNYNPNENRCFCKSDCSGCVYNYECIPIGIRLKINSENTYCGFGHVNMPCSPCFSDFAFVDYTRGKLTLKNGPRKLSSFNVSCEDTNCYYSRAPIEPSQLIIIKGIDLLDDVQISIIYVDYLTGKTQTNTAIIHNNLRLQKEKESDCQNNFECIGNSCINNKCLDEGFIQGIINWLKKLLGL